MKKLLILFSISILFLGVFLFSNYAEAEMLKMTLNTAVILVNFTDDATQHWTKTEAAETVFSRVGSYYKENTYDLITINGGIADVFGYYTIAKTCNIQGMAVSAKNAAVASGVDLSKYNTIIIIGYFMCGWNGAYNSGNILAVLNDKIIAHEIAHYLGMSSHANFYDCDLKSIDSIFNCTTVEYGNNYSVLGNPADLYHMSPFFKTNFLRQSNIIDVNSSGNYSIAPIEINTSSPQILRIPRGNDNLFVEYRRRIGFDVTLPSTLNGTGALIHLNNNLLDGTPTEPSSESNPVFSVGQTFIDSGIVKIFVSRASDDSLDLTIDLLATADINPPQAPTGVTVN